jgi:hypothetical protein
MPDLKDPVQRVAYWQEQAALLNGATIVSCSYRKASDDEEEDSYGDDALWIVLDVRLADGTDAELIVSRDVETNGPGVLFTGACGQGCLPQLS